MARNVLILGFTYVAVDPKIPIYEANSSVNH